jgi:hypothetical protein
MSVLQTLENAIDARVRQCTEELAAEFRKSVRPIYGTPDGLRPILLGSCLLLLVDGTRYIVTAAHLMDHSPMQSLQVAGSAGTQPVQILGKITSTVVPAGGRKADKLDIALWPIPEPKVAALGSVKFIDATYELANAASSIGRVHMAVGWPISRNKGKVNNQDRTITPTLSKYSALAIDLPALASELGISGLEHIFLEYRKYASNREGKRVSAINPIGMSGGALIDLGDFTSIESLIPQAKCAGRLSGMLIERNVKHQALVAVKAHKIVEAIRMQADAP